MHACDLRSFLRFQFSVCVVAAGILCAAPCVRADTVPAGAYKLDPRHTSVIFRLSHLGFSHFTGRFNKFEGQLDYHPEAPEQSTVDVTIYPASIDTHDDELDDTLRSENWFNTLKYPQASFHATGVERTDDNKGKITGDFTLHDVTHSLTLDTTLVGAGTMPVFGTPVVGFSATGKFDRSDYGIDNLDPLIGDEVTLQIDTEFDKDKE